MAFPKHQNKKTLLAAVDDLNKVCATKLQVKSKSVQVICDTLTAAIEGLDHSQLVENVSDETLETLTLFNIIADFVDEDYEFSENFEESVESITDKTVQATEAVVFHETADDLEEEDVEETPEDEQPEEPIAAEIKSLLAELMDGKVKKKRAKKIEKKIEKLKAKLPEPTAKKEKKAPAKKRAPSVPKEIPEKIALPRPGIIRSIIELVAEKPRTEEQVCKALSKRYPDKNAASMASTVKVQIGGKKRPLRVEYERGVHVVIEGEGDKRTVHVTDELPEYVKPEPKKKAEPKVKEKPTETVPEPEMKKKKKKKKKGKKKK